MALFDRSVSRVTGPLACYAAGFAGDLAARGWSTDSIYRHLWLMRDLSAWMSAEGLDAGQLSPSAAERFVPVGRVIVGNPGRPELTALRDPGRDRERDRHLHRA